MQDRSGKTPLRVLCSLPCLQDAFSGAISALLETVQGKEAAFM